MSDLFHRLARGVEDRLDARAARRGRDRPVLDPYLGYATPEHLVGRARVLSAVRRHEPAPTQTRWTNLRQMASLFVTGEVDGVTVEGPGGVTAVSDPEGYVTLLVPRADAAPGWTDLRARARGGGGGGPERLPVLVPRPDAAFGVISDIDDTMMDTGAYSLARSLWTSFTGNALTREVFPDAVRLMAGLHEDGRNPVFYVSSSPWNLHHFLTSVFAVNGLPRGPKFLKDYGVGEGHLVSGSHGGHKGGAIDVILTANPDLPFVLIGDTGQHDAEIYADAARRHPGRIARAILRRPGPEAGRADDASRAAMDELRDMGVRVDVGADYRGALEGPRAA